ncbi:O-antigen ligase family protein, partial [Candidatus Daviesbacteria bacterium]|nr:O-antigen ligase family protein [Candidatus Daviesbacteria bacterium]
MAQRILTISFYLLFFLTPLVWAPMNFELFEYNKMMFVYLLTIIIGVCWVWKMAQTKSLILNKTPLDIPLMLFLAANILSTIFSVDHHTSIWGYYSRSNGGLLSTISYLILYYALVSNFEKVRVFKFLKAAIFGGGIIAIWAILEHFGGSISCAILTGKFNDACWVQDVKARVFATLGQPNWLAAYLAMLIFPALYFTLTATKKSSTILYTLYSILFYLAFTFTYSRGASLGLLAGLVVFIAMLSRHKHLFNPRGCILIISSFLAVNLLFGSALTNFKLLSKFAPPSRPSLTTAIKASGTQLETGGTESGKIRLIVWKGALEIFKHYPIFGSGVETFAYSYYNFRPVEHNLVSEWDFLYNKAHNEYLNYLSTTGILGD